MNSLMSRSPWLDPGEQNLTFRVHNGSQESIDLYIEAWGDRINVDAKMTVYVYATGPATDGIEIEHRPKSITIWTWGGSRLMIFDEKGDVIFPRS